MRTQYSKQWQNITPQLQMPTSSRHGSVVKITPQILQGLIDHFQQGSAEIMDK